VPLNLTIPLGLQKYSETLPVALPINVYVPDVISVQSTSLLTVKGALALGWFILVSLIAVAILWRAVLLQRSLKDYQPIERQDILGLHNRLCRAMGFRKPVPLCSMDIDSTNGPVVFGIFRPRIYLPNWIANAWTVKDIEPVLFHELAHIKRYDLIVNLLQIIIQAVYFFHPLVWVANWKIRRLREDICDDIAIDRIGSEKRRYSESILKVVEGTLYQPVFGFVSIGVIENKNSLARRIKRIMSDKYNLYKKVTFSSILALIAVAIISFILVCENPSAVDGNNPNIQEKPIDLAASPVKFSLEIPQFLPLENQPKIIGGYEAIRKNLKYPESAKKDGIEGVVFVKALIGIDGIPERIELVKGLGNDRCNLAAIEAVSRVKFTPAMQDNKPVRFWFNIPIRFRLPDTEK